MYYTCTCMYKSLSFSQDITKKYEALLQMFGEKVEEAEELRLDIQDLKSMYRQQVLYSSIVTQWWGRKQILSDGQIRLDLHQCDSNMQKSLTCS